MTARDRGRRVLHIMALAGRLEEAAFRYRVGQFVEPLRSLGIEVQARALPRDHAGRMGLFAEVGAFDVVWLLRRTLTASEMRELRGHARRLVFDVDDAIWGRDSNRLVRLSAKRRRRFARTVRAADRVLAGNEYLADAARRFSDAVEVVPTCLEVERYVPREDRPAGDALNLVWIGQASTLGYLKGILGALEVFAAGRPARLRVIADVFPRSARLEIVPVRWCAETELRELAVGDVGLAPLSDDRWTRGKCGLKILQYMAAGLPVVASPVGVQVKMIGRDERGRLAASSEEWVAHLTALADDPAERRRCGRAGRAFVERGYNLADWVSGLARTFRSVVSREGAPA